MTFSAIIPYMPSLDQTTPPAYQLRPKKPTKWWKIPLLIVLMLVLAFGLAVAFQTLDLLSKYKQGQINWEQLTGQSSTNQPGLINVATDDDPMLGNTTATITIVEFADFTCPVCKQSYPIIKQLYLLYPRDIRIIFRDFPIVSEMSITAALAGQCAKEQGDVFFWSLHDKMFDNQEQLTTDLIKSLAAATQLDTGRFNQCLDSQKYKNEISQDLNAAYQAGAAGTPTFFVNNEKVTGFQTLASWREAINYLLQQAK
ncbi:MAG: thioredoxin domain-containing protein [Patescibacteria group bacterium]